MSYLYTLTRLLYSFCVSFFAFAQFYVNFFSYFSFATSDGKKRREKKQKKFVFSFFRFLCFFAFLNLRWNKPTPMPSIYWYCTITFRLNLSSFSACKMEKGRFQCEWGGGRTTKVLGSFARRPAKVCSLWKLSSLIIWITPPRQALRDCSFLYIQEDFVCI